MNLAHFLFSPITLMSFVEKTKISDKPLFTAPYLNIRYLHVSLWDRSVQNLYARTVSQIYQPCDLPFFFLMLHNTYIAGKDNRT